MHLEITHDTDGNIKGIAASPPDAPRAHMQSKPGDQVTEVDVPDLEVEAGDDAIFSRLADFVENYRVEVDARSGRLTRRTGA